MHVVPASLHLPSETVRCFSPPRAHALAVDNCREWTTHANECSGAASLGVPDGDDRSVAVPLSAVYFETLLFDWTLQLYAALHKRFVNNSVFVACHPPRFRKDEIATSASVNEVALAESLAPAVAVDDAVEA